MTSLQLNLFILYIWLGFVKLWCLTIFPVRSFSFVLLEDCYELFAIYSQENNSHWLMKNIKLFYNFILLIVPRQYFFCGSICFMFWCQIFVPFESYVRFHIFI